MQCTVRLLNNDLLVETAEGKRVPGAGRCVPGSGESVKTVLGKVCRKTSLGHSLGQTADSLAAGASEHGIVAGESTLHQRHDCFLHLLRAHAALALSHTLQAAQYLKTGL
jgi:hypothetical protein